MSECRCRYCGSFNDYWTKFCPVCGRGPGAMVPTQYQIGSKRSQRSKVISSLAEQPREDVPRIPTGFPNLDEMFGGKDGKFGLAQGSVIQLAGQPGCGKSTLLAHIAAFLKGNCLYVTSEESKRRLAARVRRVAGEEAAKYVDAISTIDDGMGLTNVCMAMRQHAAKVIIIDSLQGLRKDDAPTEVDMTAMSANEAQEQSKRQRRQKQQKIFTSNRGKHSQLTVRDIAMDLIKEANKRKLTMIMVCHLTKDGALAGLKEIEHMVDCVAWFKGQPNAALRTVSCSKNREGDTMVTADFEMTEFGLYEKHKDSGKIIVPKATKLSAVTDADDDDPNPNTPPPLPPLPPPASDDAEERVSPVSLVPPIR